MAFRRPLLCPPEGYHSIGRSSEGKNFQAKSKINKFWMKKKDCPYLFAGIRDTSSVEQFKNNCLKPLPSLYITHCRHLNIWWCLLFCSVLAEWNIRVPMQHLKSFGFIRRMDPKNIRSSKGTKWVFWMIMFCEFASNSGYLNWQSKQSSKQQGLLRLERKVRGSSAQRWGAEEVEYT